MQPPEQLQDPQTAGEEMNQTAEEVEKPEYCLPEYTPVERVPNKTYNTLEGKDFADLINKLYEGTVK